MGREEDLGCVISGPCRRITLTFCAISGLAFLSGERNPHAHPSNPLGVAYSLPFQNRYLPIVYKIWDLSSDGRYLASQLVTWNSEKIVRA